jgi:hypothetical protein
MDQRARTISERFGFLDNDRKNPNHDHIQLWVYQNIRSVLIGSEAFPGQQIPESIPLKMEYPICQNNIIVGFADLFCVRYAVGVEVKTSIPTAGDLIRQIHLYKTYEDAKWIVVSPDAKFENVLREQGIYFFKFPGLPSIKGPQLGLYS